MKHDKDVTAMFEARGWKVLRIWECELKKRNETILVEKIQSILSRSSERTQRCLTDCPWPFPGAYINEAK